MVSIFGNCKCCLHSQFTRSLSLRVSLQVIKRLCVFHKDCHCVFFSYRGNHGNRTRLSLCCTEGEREDELGKNTHAFGRERRGFPQTHAHIWTMKGHSVCVSVTAESMETTADGDELKAMQTWGEIHWQAVRLALGEAASSGRAASGPRKNRHQPLPSLSSRLNNSAQML